MQPELYGAERHPLTDPARPDRDAWELALFRGAEERRMPVLAICRGLQLVNVARGGTLHQHLPEALGTERYRVGGGVFAENTVEVEGGTALAALLGEGDFGVHSYHHQGVDRLGEGLIATARDRRRAGAGLRVHRRRATSSACSGTRRRTAEDRRLFAGLVAQARGLCRDRRE